MYSKLDIINAMLASTGTRPLTAQQFRHPLYMKAGAALTKVSKAVQSMGLWFNSEVRCVQQQADGTIVVPQGCIKADPVDRRYNLTLRGNKMYDLNTGNFEIGEDLTLKMIFVLELDQMPLAALEYIMHRAVYEFYLDQDGADPKLSNYRNQRDTGWTVLWREHLRQRQSNHFDNPNHTTAKLRRGYGAGRWQPVVN